MKKIFTDKNNQEEVTANSGLEYCIVRTGGLTVDPPTGIINVMKEKIVLLHGLMSLNFV
jgi:NAD(P)H-binding